MIVVLADGCWDPLHIGHVYHLQEAKKLGDKLVVAVTKDDKINKPGHPIFNQEQRKEMLQALQCVDDVTLVSSGGEAVQAIRPDVYVKGIEYDGKLKEQELVEAYGGRVAFVSGPIFSSSKLVSGGYLKVPGTPDR